MHEIKFERASRFTSPKFKIYSGCALFVVIGVISGILIGRYGLCKEQKPSIDRDSWDDGLSQYLLKDGNPTISKELIDNIDSANIRTYLEQLSENPHLAGTDADLKQAKEIQQFWKDVGLDEAFITPYDVLLSYPNTTDESNMNQIQILNDTGGIEYASPLYEDILYPSENKSNVVAPFNAYSAPGIVTSTELIYVNYGRVEDYDYLKQNMASVNVTGKIVIARYGKIFRGDKAEQAARHGAKGLIIFSDPADYANGQTEDVYPNSVWLPPSGAQRGTVKKVDGDPLTPGYPAISSAFRLEENDPNMKLPTIPVHPIGYGIARKLFEQMNGSDLLPNGWKGAMNVTYRVGGPLKHSNWTVKMRISTSNQRRTIHNVFGIIRGAIEPDRYVLMGNHRDAWVFGAIDPSSGTAVMKEVSRAMGQMVKADKWRPRRTIIFCSWGAEEYGLIGSNEWVEQYNKNLQTRAVAYINVDIAVSGNYSFYAAASPLLNNLIYESTKKISSPDMTNTYANLYERWAHSSPDKEDTTKPSIEIAGSGSDHAPFVQLAGVPICDLTYDFKDSSYPLYHSKYETFYVVDKLIDPGFKYHKTIGQIVAELTRRLSDDLMVPFVVTDFSKKLKQLASLFQQDYETLLHKHNIDINSLIESVDNFTKETVAFQSKLNSMDKKDPFVIRKINDQMILLEKAFIDPQGLPGRPFARHVLFADSSVNSYASSSFPGLVDALFEIENDPNQKGRWNVVRKHFSVILFTIESAASTLRDVSKFIL